MEKITSRQNPLIRHIRRLGTDAAYRRECGEYVCDGEKLLEEALRWGVSVKSVLWARDPLAAAPDTARQYTVPGELLDYASPLKSSPGVLFTAEMRAWPDAPPGRTLVLETVQDPGNLGAILRTANALNMDAVVLTGECADVYNPKTVRAAMGALFRQRIYRMEAPQLRAWLDRHGCRLYGAALSNSAEDIRALTLENTAVAVGNEGGGLSETLLALCDGTLVIPMNPACESLNAAIAAAIIMWELDRRGNMEI